MPYTLALQEFSGPLEKLLGLIEARKLEVSAVSLAQVTDDFLRYLEGLKKRTVSIGRDEYLRLLADFIVVASQLVLIKSKSLLPDFTLSGEEEEEVRSLERRLRFYRELKPAMRALAREWRGGNREYARPYLLHSLWTHMRVFYPGATLAVDKLAGALASVTEGLEMLIVERETIREKIVTVEEKIREVVQRLKEQGGANFSRLAAAKSRSEIIVLFLAILHLAREQEIILTQDGHFSDIAIAKRATGR